MVRALGEYELQGIHSTIPFLMKILQHDRFRQGNFTTNFISEEQSLFQMNEEKGMYGYDRTKSIFHSLGEKTPEEIVEHLKNSASEWVGGKDPDDDVTFVVIKVK